ncbi:MAG: DUF5659 domain-containing protein [Ignavibacteria bacterium]
MIIKQSANTINDCDKFFTYDIGLAASLFTLGYTMLEVDNQSPKKSRFIFRRDEHIDNMIAQYWDNKLTLPARSLFENLKMLKNRLYSVIV